MKLDRNLKTELFYKDKPLYTIRINAQKYDKKCWGYLKSQDQTMSDGAWRGTIEFQISREDWYGSKDTYQDTYNNDLQLVVLTSDGIYKSEQFEMIHWSEEWYGPKDELIINGDFIAMMKKEENSPYPAVTEAMEIAEKSDLKMGRVEDNPKFIRAFDLDTPDMSPNLPGFSIEPPKKRDRKILIDNSTGREIELEYVGFVTRNSDDKDEKLTIKVETKEPIDFLIPHTTFSLSVISEYSTIKIDNAILTKYNLVDCVYYVIPAEKRLEDLKFEVESYPDVHTGDMILKIYRFDHSGEHTIKRAIKLRVDPNILFELPEGAEIPQRCINNKE